MPEQDAVIAITSGSGDMQGILNMVWNHLLPAMDEHALPANETALASLNTKLENLKLSTVQGKETLEIATEISSKKIIMEENPQGIESIVFNIDDHEKSMVFWTSEGKQEIPIGYNEMLKGEMIWSGMGKVVTAASGAWIGDNIYRMILYNYESPHAVTYNFKFDGSEVIVHSAFNVFFGPNEQQQMKGRLEQ